MALTLIGGRFRNRTIHAPKGTVTRPTSALLRKTVFDICRPYLENARFLDLFAGSGAIGLEAISQGAASATFVDQDRNALACIRENIQLLHLEKCSSILKGDVVITLKRLQKEKENFDIVYIDPPYAKTAPLPLILELLDKGSLLAEGAIVFIEEGTPPLFDLQTLPLEHLAHKDSRTCGKSLLHQYHYL